MTQDYSKLPHPERVAEVLQELVGIPSINPGFEDGVGEREVASYVKRFLSRLGLQAVDQPVEADRSNVFGLLEGRDRKSRILLEAHMDTVQIQGMTVPPFAGEIRDGRLYGRGACDTKASLAAMLVAMETLVANELVPSLSVALAAVVDEEIGYKGVSALADFAAGEAARYELAIVGEPTSLNIIAAHKGCVRFHIDVQGTAGHSSNPGLADNAIERAFQVVEVLQKLERETYPALAHPLTGPPTHCISMIRGGAAPNTVPDLCRLTLDRRTVPGEEPLEAYRGIKSKLLEAAAGIPGLRLDVREPFLTDYALDTPADSPCVERLLERIQMQRKGAGILGAPYGSDASKLARAGIPSIVFGPGSIAQAHTEDEWVDLEEVTQAARILVDFLMNVERE
ncbi:hypothetical protein AWM70_08915 [Paenibacillus yonginensis]|uniref:Probable succinyl-diaminopimelate desuccinylase n=1 Tax=Paenibacillus yonginensis TaxID=1462996 RepID=A0A1B1MZV1_9BACL|nr:M20 family metallopeptidase [Paenibacillus yonginensis]ANS74695.1 hypothetical protein AWM70_08915 [Paenibacillus yonginensis]